MVFEYKCTCVFRPSKGGNSGIFFMTMGSGLGDIELRNFDEETHCLLFRDPFWEGNFNLFSN